MVFHWERIIAECKYLVQSKMNERQSVTQLGSSRMFYLHEIRTESDPFVLLFIFRSENSLKITASWLFFFPHMSTFSEHYLVEFVGFVVLAAVVVVVVVVDVVGDVDVDADVDSVVSAPIWKIWIWTKITIQNVFISILIEQKNCIFNFHFSC